jgi:hypothetical protein
VRTNFKKLLADTLGVLTAILLLVFWMIVLNPWGWNVRFPGGLQGGALMMVSMVLTSFLAALWGRRVWRAILIAAIATFVYVGFIYRMPFWY